MPAPGISVVIRTLDSASTLGKVLARLDLTPDDELVIVDSGSSDGTLAMAASAGARIVRMRREEFTYGGALNLGFETASRPWVLSLSSHCVPVRGDLLVRFRKAAMRFGPEVAAAVGPIVGEFPSPLPDGVTLYHPGELAKGFGFGAGNPNCLYRRAAWERRPFNPDGSPGEDFQWYFAAMGAGEVIAAVHAAAVEYASRRSMVAFYQKGRLERRFTSRLFEVHQPSIAGWLVRILKMAAFVALRRMHWRTAMGSVAYYAGMLAEARADRRREQG